MLGVAAELILLEHYEELRQWVPLGLLAVGLPTTALAMAKPGRPALLALRAVMAAFVLAGAVGVYFHYSGNVEFELEMDRTLGGTELALEAIRGATPTLAPTAMAHLGLLGLLATWRHPALDRFE